MGRLWGRELVTPVAMVLMVVAGCGDGDPQQAATAAAADGPTTTVTVTTTTTGPPVGDLEAGRARWRQVEPASYTATLSVYDGPEAPATGGCPADGTVHVQVTDGEVTSATSITRMCRIDPAAADVPSIEDVFAVATTASGAPDSQLAFDPQWGFPTSVSGQGGAIGASVSAFSPGTSTTLVGGEVTDGLAGWREAWAGAGLTDYRFVLEWQCFCMGGPIELTVRDGRPVSATLLDDTVVDPVAAIPEQAPRTIDALFDFVDAKAPTSDAVAATFDDRLGHPTMVAFDFMRNAIDDELTLVVRDVEPLDG